MRVTALEAIGDHELLAAARKDLDQQPVAPRHHGEPALQSQPLAHRSRQARPARRIGQDRAHARRELRGQGQAPAGIDRHLRLVARRQRHIGRVVAHALEAQELAREHERVAEREALHEILLDLAELAPALQHHLQHRLLDDRADIEPVLPRHQRADDMPRVVRGAEQATEALVALERIAAGRDEGEHVVEAAAIERGVWRGLGDLGEQGVSRERCVAGAAQHVLCQHIEPAFVRARRIEFARIDGVERGAALQHLEAIGRHQQGTARHVEAMIGAPDPLQQPRRALGRPDLHDQIDVAPVDAEIERRRRDDRAQPAGRHRGLDLAALLDREAAVMERDRQLLLVEAPQRVEAQFGLRTRVDEQDRAPGLAQRVVDIGHRRQRHVSRPRHPRFGHEDANIGMHAAATPHDQRELVETGAQPARETRRIGDRGREPDAARKGRQAGQPRQPEGKQITALVRLERMQFVEHDDAQSRKLRARLRIGQHQRQRLRRGEQEMRRLDALARAFGRRRIAGARLGAQAERQVGDRQLEIAMHIDRERFERRHIERVQPVAGRRGELDQTRQEPGQRLAAAGRRHQQRRAPGTRRLDQRELMGMRSPAALRKPARERIGESHRGQTMAENSRHDRVATDTLWSLACDPRAGSGRRRKASMSNPVMSSSIRRVPPGAP